MLILTAIFLLAIQGIGLAHSFADKRIEAWQTRLRESTKSGEINPRFHAGRILRLVNRLLRNALVIVLLLLYFGIGFSVFPRTKVISGVLREIFGSPLEDAVRAVENYLPKLGYLVVILMIGWAKAGIEIMTPTILSHRDAGEVAVPTELFPSRPQPRGIRITVDPPDPSYK